MSAQALVLASVLAMAGQTPSDTIHFGRRTLTIPLTFQESRRGEIQEVRLFASPDLGKTWQVVDNVTPEKEFISFTAPADGTYWLRVASVNRAGRQQPENVREGPPDQKVVIDTLRPLVRIVSATRQGEEVVVNWEVQEAGPDWTSFRVEWQVKDASPLWTAMPATPGLTGQARFRPASSAPLLVRITLKDLAGNVGVMTSEVAGSSIGVAGGVVPGGPGVISAIGVPAAGERPLTGTGDKPATVDKLFPPPIAPPGDFGPPLKPPALEPPPVPPWTPPDGGFPKPVAPTPDLTPRRPLPPLQYFNLPQVPLEYELSKVGPSGIGGIDLFWTRDDGLTWEKYADDPALLGSTKTGRFQRLIELPGDGVYGFSIVVTSRAGRGKTPPKTGDMPQMRVEIDTIAPVAEMFAPVPDPSRPNSLLLRWTAKDKNLTANPVTWEWSERRDGPWQLIADNVANTGKYAWSLPDSLPVQVYLRLRVRDAASNQCVLVSPEPQLVDLSEPEGRLLGIPGGRP